MILPKLCKHKHKHASSSAIVSSTTSANTNLYPPPLAMDKRLSRDLSLQKKVAENRRKAEPAPVPDLTDLMDAMFFGTSHHDMQAYNLTGTANNRHVDDEEEDFDDSTRSNSSRLTQEWLEEARRMVASSPSRSENSPSRFGVVSPRFAAQPGRLSMSAIDRRDPLSRSARRNRSVESFSGEILSKTVRHNRNRSEAALADTTPDSPTPASPASAVHQWFSNILKPRSDPAPTPTDPTSPSGLPPRQPPFRRSRFIQVVEPSPASPQAQQGIPVPNFGHRTFKTPTSPLQDASVLSPPKRLVESAQRRSFSSSTCSLTENDKPLSPPKNLVQSAQRRSLARSTCSLEKNSNGWSREEEGKKELGLNGFLKEQRSKIQMILDGEIDSRAKVVLSGPSNSTSSMAAAICYSWLMEKRARKSNEDEFVFVPVMNLKRERMWKQQQAAWLFHHVALDASALLFSDEVDLESLMMAGQLSMLIVGQDILQTSGQVGSSCTILTDNYCEDAYDLLQSPMVKNLLLAGILLDTQNLKASANVSMGRDAEAVQLLLVGSSSSCRSALFDRLMQDRKDNSFFEVLRRDYGKPPNESTYDKEVQVEHKPIEREFASKSVTPPSSKNSTDIKTSKNSKGTPKSEKPDGQPKQSPAATSDNNRGKNKFFLAKWFGFGPK